MVYHTLNYMVTINIFYNIFELICENHVNYGYH